MKRYQKPVRKGESRAPVPPSMPCGYCRKLAYPSRKAAKKMMRSQFPHLVGAEMNVYRCPYGGSGYHIGHRDTSITERQDLSG